MKLSLFAFYGGQGTSLRKELYMRYSVEELPNGGYIATSWCPEDGLENDRHVTNFETYSAALAFTYEEALHAAVACSGLKLECDL